MFEFLQDPAKPPQDGEFEEVDVFDEDGRLIGKKRVQRERPVQEPSFKGGFAQKAALNLSPEQSHTIARREATDRVIAAFEAAKKTKTKPLGAQSAYAMTQEQADPQRFAPSGINTEILADPSRAARVAEQMGIPTDGAVFRALEEAVKNYNQVVSQPLERQIRSQLAAGDFQSISKSVAATQKEIERLSKEKREIVGQGPVSDREAAELKEKTAAIDAAIKANMAVLGAQQDAMSRARGGAGGAAQTQNGANQSESTQFQSPADRGAVGGVAVDPNPGKRDTSVYNAVGKRNYEMLLDLLGDSGTKLGRQWDQPTYAPVAVVNTIQQMTLMGLIDPDFASRYVSELRSIKTPEDLAAAGERKTGRKAEREAADAEQEAGRVRAERKNKVQELFEAQELQSWGSVLAYIGLSLFLGPRMAFLFFSNAKKKGVLKYEIDQLGSDGQRLEQLKTQKEQEARASRGRAADLMLRGNIRQDDRRWQIMRDQQRREEQHAARLAEINERAKQKGVSENPEYKKAEGLVRLYDMRARTAIANAREVAQAESFGAAPKGAADAARREVAKQNALAEDAMRILEEMSD